MEPIAWCTSRRVFRREAGSFRSISNKNWKGMGERFVETAFLTAEAQPRQAARPG